MTAMRQSFAGTGWVNPYVTDGLIAMWDGEWNAGGGVHDSSAASIADLSGNSHPMEFVGVYGIGSNYFSIDGTNSTVSYGYVSDFVFGSPMTQEMCVEVNKRHAFGRFFGDGRGLCCHGGSGTMTSGDVSAGYLNGFGKDAAFNARQPGFNTPFWQALTVGNSVATFHYPADIHESMACSDSQYSGTSVVFNRGTPANRGISGKIYNLRIYSRVLSNAELAHNLAVDEFRLGRAMPRGGT